MATNRMPRKGLCDSRSGEGSFPGETSGKGNNPND